MKTTFARMKAMVLAAVALGAVSASAKIRYWDNPAYKAFDVDDYVQNGLLLHYDGIRNAGKTTEHDNAATTWVNLGSGGAIYNMARYSYVDSEWKDGDGRGSWVKDGFVFDRLSVFHEMAAVTIPQVYTIQTLVNATASEQTSIGYVMCDYGAANWAACCIGIRATGGGTGNNAFYAVSGNRPYFNVASATTPFSYATFIHNGSEGVFFPGTVAPWYATDGSYNASLENKSYVRANGISLGGHYPTANETFAGTIKNFRFYTRDLTDIEVGWNRVVDEARFFGRAVALPVTNVVVASNIPIAFGEEPIGCYAVDGTHVFSAPASKVVKGRTYTLNGYTVETWDGEKWGAAQEVAAGSGDSISYTAADNALVRLTWRWTAGDGLVNYDAEDYVQNGLVLNYDGIRNVGLEAPHDSAATVWKNLGNGGEMYDMIRHSITDGVFAEASGAGGRWGSDGFYFDKAVLFHLRDANKFTVGTAYTLQTLVNATAADQEGTVYLMCPSIKDNENEWLRFSIGIRNNEFDYGGVKVPKSMYHCAYDNAGASRAALPGTDFSYANVMLNGNKAVIFSGTQVAWSGTPSTGYMCDESKTPNARTYTKGISLGGRWPEATPGQMFKGMLHAYRHYDRVLNDDELAWNRVVDNARYFPVTNVVVETTRTGVFGNEKDGAYQVANAYTFTAPESVTVGKFTYAPVGYAVQVWDEARGVWGKATEYTGNAYAYSTSAGKVRLLWRWKVIKGIRTLADYDVTDYIAGGLTFNLDGIRNAGVDADHAETPATWANVGTFGTAGNANIRKDDAERVTNWRDKGYYFDGNTRFFATLPYSTTFTLQLLTDAIQNDQHIKDSSGHNYLFQAGGQHLFAMSTCDTMLYFRTQGEGKWSSLGYYFAGKDKPLGYINAVLDDATKSASVFPGVSSSTGATKTFETMADAISRANGNLTLGSGGGNPLCPFKGTLNYFRYYDRVLSESELAWNREVDEARYFGVVSTTNVVVVAGDEGSVQAEAGAYKVDGEWTFTASKALDSDGNVVDVERYAVEELVGNAWKNRRVYSGTSYTYTVGVSPRTVRLKWLGRAEGMTIIVR